MKNTTSKTINTLCKTASKPDTIPVSKTLLATSMALALGVSAAAFAQPTLNDDNNFADNTSTAMDDRNNIGNTVAKSDSDIDDSYNTKTETETKTKLEDSYNSKTDNSVNTLTKAETENKTKIEDSYNAKTDNSVKTLTKAETENKTKIEDSYNAKTETKSKIEDSYNTKTDNSVRTLTKAETENKTKVEDSYNTKTDNSVKTLTKTETKTKIEDSYNSKTDNSVNRTAKAEKGSVAMNDGNTVYYSETVIDDIEVELAVNNADLNGTVSYNTVTTTIGPEVPPSATIDAHNRIDDYSANFKGVGIITQNSAASSLTQANINVQSHLVF